METLPIEEVLRLDKQLQMPLCNIVNKFIEKRNIEQVYHYTSSVGLHSILTNQKLWFSRWDCLNDYSENKYIHDLIAEGLEAFSDYPDFVACFSEINDLQRKWKNESEELRADSNLFIASFSLNKDALNLWTYYTKSSHSDGYCIGFNYNGIFCENGLDIITSEVIYDPIRQKRIIASLLKSFLSIFNNLGKHEDTKIDRYMILGRRFEYYISEISCFFKHPAFYAEEEFRAVVRMHKNSKKHIELPLKVRQNGGMLVPYTELEFKKEHVASVTISPTLIDKPVLPGLHVLRSELGMNFEIHRSQIPFRAM